MSNRSRQGDARIATGGLIQDRYMMYQDVTREMNYETNFTYKRTFGDFSVDALVGGNIRKNLYDRLQATAQGGLSGPNFFDISASVARPLIERPDYERQNVRSLYGRASLGYKNFFYLDVTGRNDWSSSLPVDNNSFFYKSIGSSFVFTELFKDNPFTQVLTSGKLRGSWAEVGDDPDPF